LNQQDGKILSKPCDPSSEILILFTLMMSAVYWYKTQPYFIPTNLILSNVVNLINKAI